MNNTMIRLSHYWEIAHYEEDSTLMRLFSDEMRHIQLKREQLVKAAAKMFQAHDEFMANIHK